ncbi:uncharacterized protein Osi13 [Polyergus mexicanus]|uniref:uncharacterized protein Osi13 n=1 Tax=Polyergus mexicanus TaxID=615972 RepID=UPI0038B4ADF7
MLLPYVLLLLPVIIAAQESQSMNTLDREILRNDGSKDILDWIGESFLNAIDAFFPDSRLYGSTEESKKTKTKLNKYIIPLIVGFVLIKSILLPLTLKALAILSGKAVVLSLMSLILAAIVGLKKAAQEGNYEANKYRRQDTYDFDNIQEFEPYRIYKERRKKK